jgi:hypothetical protein
MRSCSIRSQQALKLLEQMLLSVCTYSSSARLMSSLDRSFRRIFLIFLRLLTYLSNVLISTELFLGADSFKAIYHQDSITTSWYLLMIVTQSIHSLSLNHMSLSWQIAISTHLSTMLCHTLQRYMTCTLSQWNSAVLTTRILAKRYVLFI